MMKASPGGRGYVSLKNWSNFWVEFEGGVLSPKPNPSHPHPPPPFPFSVHCAVSYLLQKWLWTQVICKTDHSFVQFIYNAFCFTGILAWTYVLLRIAESFLITTTFFFVFMYAALDQSQLATLLVSWCWLRFFWRSTHIRAPKLPLYALLCGSPLDSHDHPNIGTPRQGPRSHWSLHLLLALSRYRLTDWTLLPSTAFNHVSMCSQSCANQTHLDTSCCWQYYNVLSHVFIMVSRYRWSRSHPGFMLRFWRDHR